MTLKPSIKKMRLIFGVCTIAFAVVSLLFAILDGTKDWGITPHPILTFFFFIITLFAIMFFAMGIAKKFTWYAFIGAILLFISLLFALIAVFEVVWWGVIIGMFAYVCIAFAGVMIANGSKTEDLALNNHVEYKDYKERRAEKEAKEAEEAANAEPLPEIKTFKD